MSRTSTLLRRQAEGRPERFGLVPDGAAGVDTAAASVEAGYTVAEARATLTFWLFGSGLFLTSCFGTALTFHHYAILAQSGIDRALAAAFVPVGVMGAVGNLATGVLISRVISALVIGSSIGPLVFAFGHDLTGTYAPVMLLAAAPAFALAAVTPFLRLRRGGRAR